MSFLRALLGAVLGLLRSRASRWWRSLYVVYPAGSDEARRIQNAVLGRKR